MPWIEKENQSFCYHRYGSLHMVTYILTWLSACVNPIIYCLTNKVRSTYCDDDEVSSCSSVNSISCSFQHYREAHLAFVRSLFCLLRQRNNQTSFTESTNLSLPLKQKISSQRGASVQIIDGNMSKYSTVR